MAAIPLQQAMAIDLNQRYDEKFVGNIGQLKEILECLKDEFCVQVNGEKTSAFYSTLYWDTDEFSFFNDHSRGKSRRSKIRKRLYTDTQTSFLEIKRSINGKTFKTRTSSSFSANFDGNDRAFLQINDFNPDDFKPVLYINYQRIILWDKSLEGRMTIDLMFNPADEKKSEVFSNIYIFEIKGSRSFINRTIRKIRFPIYRNHTSFTKYGIGLIHNHDFSRKQSKDLFPIYSNLLKINQTT